MAFMAHLIEPFTNEPVGSCLAKLEQAHDYLAKAGANSIKRAGSAAATLRTWGAEVKRVRVTLNKLGRPQCIPPAVVDHSIIEIMNQCATLERLLDVLRWVQTSQSGLTAYRIVERCHPTTSSSKSKGGPDNDLVLLRQGEEDEDQRKARFEVSDVASEDDGNRKELKDLISLGVLCAGSGTERYENIDWPEDAMFLVVSEEFGRGLIRRVPAWVEDGHLHYQARALGPTTILEVRQGQQP